MRGNESSRDPLRPEVQSRQLRKRGDRSGIRKLRKDRYDSARIVRDQLQGKYVSAGKDSHFRVRNPHGESAQQIQKPKPSLTGKAESYPWRPFDKANGEWTFTDKAAELKKALEEAGGKLDYEGYTYKFSGEDRRFINRFPKKAG